MQSQSYDFCGWVTRNNLRCSDGRTIMKDAFKQCDGMIVPLVWNHRHDEPENVLGLVRLENRDDGVYGYGSFNDTENAKDAKLLVEHGDISAMSIYANQVKQQGGNVIHGKICEVSLVLTGANPGAYIESVIRHSGDVSEDEIELYTGEEFEFVHSDEEQNENTEKGAQTMADNEQKDKTIEEIFNTLTEEQKQAVYAIVGAAVEEAKGEKPENAEEVSHADDSDDETIGDIFNSLTEKQKNVVYALIGAAVDEAKGEKAEDGKNVSHADKEGEDEDGGETIAEIFDTLTDKQKQAVYAIVGAAIEQKNGGDAQHSGIMNGGNDMKHNVFDNTQDNVQEFAHSDMEAILADAKRGSTLKDAVIAHGIDPETIVHAVTDEAGNSITYGIANVGHLFPEDRALTDQPAFVSRDMTWVKRFMSMVHHSPFSRIKSIYANITEADARAKGYVKGTEKYDEVISVLKRSTPPTTVYKKQQMDRDDVIDITDFDVVAWLKGEMRMMLDEEIARAALVGDGRSNSSPDKINPDCIRPIWTDSDTYTIKSVVTLPANATADQKAKAIIRAAVKSRKDYKGTGNPVFFTTEDVLTDCLLMEDNFGRVIYDTQEKLATAMRVKDIITVPCMEGLTRTVDGDTRTLAGIIVNLGDYNIGADKGGSVNLFDDFDIDFNQQKYLIETRCSGALTIPYSAIAIETVVAASSSSAGTDEGDDSNG